MGEPRPRPQPSVRQRRPLPVPAPYPVDMRPPSPPLGVLFAIGGCRGQAATPDGAGGIRCAAGASDARIAVVSSASSLGAEVVEVYTRVFTSLGARQVTPPLRPESRAQAHDPDLVDALGKVSAIFMTGGNQLEAELLDHRHTVRGGDPGGVSARRGRGWVPRRALASWPEHMIAFGAGGSTPKQRMSQLSAGLAPAGARCGDRSNTSSGATATEDCSRSSPSPLTARPVGSTKIPPQSSTRAADSRSSAEAQ